MRFVCSVEFVKVERLESFKDFALVSFYGEVIYLL